MADILIADDSAFMRALLRKILEEHHTIVGEVENGVEAVEVFKETDPDVVLMDTEMPIRDGIDATKEIKSTATGSNSIICTSAGQEKVQKAFSAGADGYVTKPFQKPSILEAIREAVSGSQTN